MIYDQRFKPYQQHQTLLFPPNLEELVHDNHPARVVSHVIDHVNLQPLFEQYPGGGASAHHPKMMLKIIVLAYVSNIFSSRKIAQACQESIPFAWIAAQQQPDHNSINRFRTERLENPLREIFTQIVFMLHEHGVLSIDKELYVDGTKMEANANRYTFVWGKAIKTNKEKLQKQLDALWNYAQQVAKEELNSAPPTSLEQITPEQLAQSIDSINEALKGKAVEKKVKEKLYRAKREWPARLQRYREQEQILNGRNSYSKTDPDATFMRTKGDRLGKGELKACYNWQIGTHNQYILHYSVHQRATDTTTLPSQVSSYKQSYGLLPERLIADAGYGSEENYSYLATSGIEAYIKDPYYDLEQQKSWQKKSPFHATRLHYNSTKDTYYCPMGQSMEFRRAGKRVSKTGYESSYREYEAVNCECCPLHGPCHGGSGNRLIRVNGTLQGYKEEARRRLSTEEGKRMYTRRNIEVESVFGNVKQNKGMRRFMLRGQAKVTTEIGLVCLSHNLKKVSLSLRKQEKGKGLQEAA